MTTFQAYNLDKKKPLEYQRLLLIVNENLFYFPGVTTVKQIINT